MHIYVEHRLSEMKQIPDDVEESAVKLLEKAKIKEVEQLKNEITNAYIDIMADIAAFCEDVMGLSPCKFALVGMGSLARKEITPFSDFENIILFENSIAQNTTDNLEDCVSWFRWYSVIFQTILINLQETIISSIAIFSFNNEHSLLGNWFYDAFTMRGTSFDGMMLHACKFPLGRQQPTYNKP